jgi:hypothetical protein
VLPSKVPTLLKNCKKVWSQLHPLFEVLWKRCGISVFRKYHDSIGQIIDLILILFVPYHI